MYKGDVDVEDVTGATGATGPTGATGATGRAPPQQGLEAFQGHAQ